MKVKTEQLVSNPNICELKIKIPTKAHQSKGIKEDIDNSISGRKMMKKSSSQLSQAWSLGSLMTDFPLSPDSFHSSVSPSLHCDSCRPSTVFYSPRFQDIRHLKQDTKLMNNSKSCKAATNIDSIRGIVGVKNKGLKSDVNGELKASNVPSNIPIREEEDSEYLQGNQQFGEAIPLPIPLSEDGTRCRKTFQELLEENERSEADTMRKAAYMHMLRKLTSKEEAIDEWESKRRTKATQQIQKLERKLEQKRAEAVQKMHKKLAETKLEAQRRKANARQSAMKLIAKHNLSRT
ncbi:unnamed protein product [Amaranthus hypochondriacus]